MVLPRPNKKNPITLGMIDKDLIADINQFIPRSRAIETIATLNIPFPSRLPDIDEDHSFPLDITSVDNTSLRQLLSYWAAQFGRVNALLGLSHGEVKRLTRRVDREERMAFVTYAPATKREVFVDKIKGDIQKNSFIRKLNLKLDHAIAVEQTLSALAKDFETYMDICSREMSWRMAEMKSLRD